MGQIVKFVCFALVLFGAPKSIFAQCVDLVQGPIVLDVNSCTIVDPKTDFRKDMDYNFLKGMTPNDKANFLKSYQGSLIKGKVVQSQAVRVGLDKRKGALSGKEISAFVAPSVLGCTGIEKKRIASEVTEICCQGSADVPCLLNTSYVFKQAKVVGDAGSVAGDPERMKAVKSASFLKGVGFFREKKYAEAAKAFEETKAAGELDVRGYYLLGLSYRNTEQCKKAIPPLQEVYDRAAKNKVWADQNSMVRRSNFLLARCLAKTNEPGRAAIILHSYLIEPRRFKAEIEESLKNPDFGWINASKEYRAYVEKAREKLKSLKK